MPLLSVVLTTYTEERLPNLLLLLDSLREQTCGEMELLFVGQGNEMLCSKVKEHSDSVGLSRIRTVFKPVRLGLSAARNLAIPLTRGDFIAFLDDDVIVPHGWASAVIDAFSDSDVVGVTGPVLPYWRNREMQWVPKEMYWAISCTSSDWKKPRSVRTGWGGNMAFRREVFDYCGLFDPTYGLPAYLAEDNEFSFRVRTRTGGQILFHPSVWVWHMIDRDRLAWRAIASRAYQIGRSRRRLQKLYSSVSLAGKRSSLEDERMLLRAIVLERIPADVRGMLKASRLSVARLSLVLCGMIFAGAGYLHETCNLRWRLR